MHTLTLPEVDDDSDTSTLCVVAVATVAVAVGLALGDELWVVRLRKRLAAGEHVDNMGGTSNVNRAGFRDSLLYPWSSWHVASVNFELYALTTSVHSGVQGKIDGNRVSYVFRPPRKCSPHTDVPLESTRKVSFLISAAHCRLISLSFGNLCQLNRVCLVLDAWQYGTQQFVLGILRTDRRRVEQAEPCRNTINKQNGPPFSAHNPLRAPVVLESDVIMQGVYW